MGRRLSHIGRRADVPLPWSLWGDAGWGARRPGSRPRGTGLARRPMGGRGPGSPTPTWAGAGATPKSGPSSAKQAARGTWGPAGNHRPAARVQKEGWGSLEGKKEGMKRRGPPLAAVAVCTALIAAGCGDASQGNAGPSMTASSQAGSSVPTATIAVRPSASAPSSSASPSAQIPSTQLNAILHRAYPAAGEWRVLGGGRRSTQWQGLLSPTERVVVTVDMHAGTVLRRVGPQGVAGARRTVQGFYAALAGANPVAAWRMLNPVVYNPNPSFRYPQTYDSFMSQNRTPGSPVRAIQSVAWMLPGPGFKYSPCECYVFGGGPHTPGGFVNVRGTLANGRSFNTVVIRGSNGTWSLLWVGHSLVNMG